LQRPFWEDFTIGHALAEIDTSNYGAFAPPAQPWLSTPVSRTANPDDWKMK
jgi:hypothetical protein